jgi:hypothetical protein
VARHISITFKSFPNFENFQNQPDLFSNNEETKQKIGKENEKKKNKDRAAQHPAQQANPRLPSPFFLSDKRDPLVRSFPNLWTVYPPCTATARTSPFPTPSRASSGFLDAPLFPLPLLSMFPNL